MSFATRMFLVSLGSPTLSQLLPLPTNLSPLCTGSGSTNAHTAVATLPRAILEQNILKWMFVSGVYCVQKGMDSLLLIANALCNLLHIIPFPSSN